MSGGLLDVCQLEFTKAWPRSGWNSTFDEMLAQDSARDCRDMRPVAGLRNQRPAGGQRLAVLAKPGKPDFHAAAVGPEPFEPARDSTKEWSGSLQ